MATNSNTASSVAPEYTTAEKAHDALALARESFVWMGTLVELIAEKLPENSTSRTLAMIALEVATRAFTDAMWADDEIDAGVPGIVG
jgi:hypothetical protein